MAHTRILTTGTFLIATSAWADIARPVPQPPQGWPQWAVVAVVFALFLSLIVVLSRFFRGGAGGGAKKNDDNKFDLFGP